MFLASVNTCFCYIYIARSEIAGSLGKHIFSFSRKMPKIRPSNCNKFSLPPAKVFTDLCIIICFNFSCSAMNVFVSYYDMNLHFHNNKGIEHFFIWSFEFNLL